MHDLFQNLTENGGEIIKTQDIHEDLLQASQTNLGFV